MNYTPDLHHRHSIRIAGYDYSQAGFYFVTICTHKGSCIFGEIVNSEMILNEFGKIAEKEWYRTVKLRPNINLGAFVIMPNHIHGIIEIQDRRGTTPRAPTRERFGKPTSNTIPTIIRGFKSSVTKQINLLRKLTGVPVWQRNYYEHIIRDEISFQQITEYIRNNPMQWPDDRYYM